MVTIRFANERSPRARFDIKPLFFKSAICKYLPFSRNKRYTEQQQYTNLGVQKAGCKSPLNSHGNKLFFFARFLRSLNECMLRLTQPKG